MHDFLGSRASKVLPRTRRQRRQLSVSTPRKPRLSVAKSHALLHRTVSLLVAIDRHHRAYVHDKASVSHWGLQRRHTVLCAASCFCLCIPVFSVSLPSTLPMGACPSHILLLLNPSPPPTLLLENLHPFPSRFSSFFLTMRKHVLRYIYHSSVIGIRCVL